MSDMIERVAKAIFFRGHEQDDMMWQHMQPHLRETAFEQACAAIEAMREPTDAMAEFAEENFDRNGDDIKVCHRAFILAALSQDTHSLPLKPQEAVKPAGSTPPSSPAGTNSDEAQP
jgi:hypothetical protein